MSRPGVMVILVLLTLVVLTVTPLVGFVDVPLRTFWDASDKLASQVLWDLRIPRICLSMLAGAALAVSGMAFQAVFRNPLATPFTLGVASGASLGASIAIYLGWTGAILGIAGTSWAAFAGASVAILLVYGLARSRSGFSATTMLLAGVAVSFFFSSVILFLQYITDFTQSFRMLRWVMGGLDKGAGLENTLHLLPLVVLGVLTILYLTRELNLITTGDELATARGVNVNRTKLVLFAVVSLMIGAVVAVCGPIGFVGLMAPHICRLLIGPDHRYLTPATLLFGGLFLTICDTIARTIIAPVELPVGIVTALLGGPFFLWLLLGLTPER